jgi:selenide,water dikinase
MGGDPVLALNIMMFPASRLPLEAYSEILRGGYDKAAEAGVRIIGGHTIDDFPPKYGLSVTGFVHPDRIVTNGGACSGDLLVLTKPVGTGIIMAGRRMGIASENDINVAKELMKQLNRTAADVMKRYNIRGATDITGFGLAGHALKMARASDVSIKINMKKVPLIGNVYSLTDEGCIPGASFRNLEFAEQYLEESGNLDYNLKMIAFDAQTSGGLLMSVPAASVQNLVNDLHLEGLTYSAIIGEVTPKAAKFFRLEN